MNYILNTVIITKLLELIPTYHLGMRITAKSTRTETTGIKSTASKKSIVLFI